MASWNTNIFNGANWQGNTNVASQRQLLSTSAGLYDDLLDFSISTLKVSTLTVPYWISTAKLYVSDIEGAVIDISGITINQDGVFNAPNVQLSSLNFKGFDNLLDVDVSFDLGLGQAIGGLVGGLGALVGGATIAVGTGAGLAIQGAEQGIATLIAGRPQNFIDNTTYETINFTSQLQVSTLGNAYPAYSSIFRTVSSVSANQVPGREIFTSTIFYPGQICIRSVSDPFNLITGDPQINSSTIQSFGSWVPLENLEPTNIIADSVSTNLLSTGQAFIQDAEIPVLSNYTTTTNNIGIAANATFAFNAGAEFDLGSSGDAVIFGDINQWNFQTNQPIVFSQLGDPGLITPGATLTLGNGAESILQLSSIFALGNIQANTGYFSSLTVNELIVISSFSTILSNVTIISTGIVKSELVSTINLEAQYIAPFTFSSLLGNPFGTYDITKYDFVNSTIYNQVSSLTQNILSYTLVEEIQDQTSFNLNVAETPQGVNYQLTPANVSQWGSSIMIFNDYQYGGSVTLPLATTFINSNLTGVFDLETQYNPNTPGYYANIQVNQVWIPGSEFSSFSTFLNLSGPNPPVSPPLGTWRFEIGSDGWIQSVQQNPTPFTTTNSNVFTISQDINDTTIAATDRLNLEAGDIFVKGTLNLTNISVESAYSINSYSSNATVSTIQGNTLFFSSITANPLGGGLNTYYYKSTISLNSNPQTVYPATYTFLNDSPGLMPQYTLLPPFIGNNYFTSYNASSWNNTIWNNNVAAVLGIPLVFCGDLQEPLGTYAGTFYINNTIVSPAYALPVYYINSAGSNLLGNVPGGTYGRITTTNGTTWSIATIPNPQGITPNSYSNILNISQTTQQTNVVDTQNLYIQAPNATITTGTLALNADQIRVNSHKYGFLETNNLNSYPIGIENTVYIDGNISWSNVPGGSDYWQSDATNVVYNITGTVYYDVNSWFIQVIPSRFRTNDSRITSWDVQPTAISIVGAGWAWGFNRYIQVLATIGGPGSNANNWNWILAIPKNYCTYI
jgi:hypothetical protein